MACVRLLYFRTVSGLVWRRFKGKSTSHFPMSTGSFIFDKNPDETECLQHEYFLLYSFNQGTKRGTSFIFKRKLFTFSRSLWYFFHENKFSSYFYFCVMKWKKKIFQTWEGKVYDFFFAFNSKMASIFAKSTLWSKPKYIFSAPLIYF